MSVYSLWARRGVGKGGVGPLGGGGAQRGGGTDPTRGPPAVRQWMTREKMWSETRLNGCDTTLAWLSC